MAEHPIRIVATDDFRRTRLTVVFRVFLAIPHLLWAALLASALLVVVIIQWFALLFTGRPIEGMHEFTRNYLRYTTQIEAYLLLAADPFPGFFLLAEKPYPVDLVFDPPAPQSRLKTLFRVPLALPAIMVGALLISGGARFGYGSGGGVAFVAASLAWFYAIVTRRAPHGLRDLTVYCLGYGAQLAGYLFLVTDRYPYTGPHAFVPPRDELAPPEAVSASVTDDLRRSRVLVFFRLPLAAPHLVWLLLWSIAAFFVAVINWVCALATGGIPRSFHRFLAAYIRYSTHVGAFLLLFANPFPGFVGKPGSYPVDVQVGPPARQHRAVTAFRLVLALPAIGVSSALGGVAFVCAVLGWFVGLVRAEMPAGFANLGAYSLRYSAQLSAYVLVLTDRYPDSGPRTTVAVP